MATVLSGGDELDRLPVQSLSTMPASARTRVGRLARQFKFIVFTQKKVKELSKLNSASNC